MTEAVYCFCVDQDVIAVAGAALSLTEHLNLTLIKVF